LLDRPVLKARIEFPPCVEEHEHRGTHDGQEAGFVCTACDDAVMGIHPSSGLANPSNTYPYATHLDIRYAPMEVVDVPALVAACTDRWYNQTLCRVNDSVVRVGVIQGDYHWHKHDNEDEFFYVVQGRFLIDLENRTVELSPGQGFVVPKGVVHRTRAPERTVILMVEGAGIVPTGGG